MSKNLTIDEIDVLDIEDFEENQVKKIEELGITVEKFIEEFNDQATLSGLEDDEEFMSIDDFIAHLEEMKSQNEPTETTELTVKEENQISDFSGAGFTGNIARPDILTNIKDKKQIFNLGKHVDKKLNDCVGQEITIDKILIKKYVKPLDTPVVDPQTGEIIADTKTSMSVVIVDKDGVSYATGSKTFGYSLISAIYDFGNDMEGLKIRIIKTLRSGAQNQSLDFELV